MTDDAITYPLVGRGLPELGPFALLAASATDLKALCRELEIETRACHPLHMSRLYVVAGGPRRFALVGPLMGAPYAAVILETLIAAGVRRFVFWGWCGAIAGRVKIGDIVVPATAVSDEGTSPHYRTKPASVAIPSLRMLNKIKEALKLQQAPFHEGAVWTTDAVFRETRSKVAHYQSRNVLAVEMETSALFTVGKFRGVEVGAILVVSDELGAFTWAPGFSNPRFKENCRLACKVAGTLTRDLSQ